MSRVIWDDKLELPPPPPKRVKRSPFSSLVGFVLLAALMWVTVWATIWLGHLLGRGR